MSTIKPGMSLDDVMPVKDIEHDSVHHTMGDAAKHYISKREQLICEALDKHFGVGEWTHGMVRDLNTKSYPDHVEFFVGEKCILKLGKLKVTLPGTICDVKTIVTME